MKITGSRALREWCSLGGGARGGRVLTAKLKLGTRSAGRLTAVVRNQTKAELTWAGLPYHIWKEGSEILRPSPCPSSARVNVADRLLEVVGP